MNVPSPVDVSELLMGCGNGKQAALDMLIPLVYEELHRLAAHQIRKESPGHTPQTTVLRVEGMCSLELHDDVLFAS